jgi:hypothetical protein
VQRAVCSGRWQQRSAAAADNRQLKVGSVQLKAGRGGWRRPARRRLVVAGRGTLQARAMVSINDVRGVRGEPIHQDVFFASQIVVVLLGLVAMYSIYENRIAMKRAREGHEADAFFVANRELGPSETMMAIFSPMFGGLVLVLLPVRSLPQHSRAAAFRLRLRPGRRCLPPLLTPAATRRWRWRGRGSPSAVASSVWWGRWASHVSF